MPVRMTPLEPPAGDAILVGDSRRAFALAQALMVQPRMSHQARGLWGYTGAGEAGHDLTVQSTGVGGPSAVAVIGDLAEAGVTTVVRLGSCVALDRELKPGTVLLVERAIACDGAGRSLAGTSPAGAASTGTAPVGTVPVGTAPVGAGPRGGSGIPDPVGPTPGPVAVKPDRELFESLRGLAGPATVSSHDLVARLDPRPEPATDRDGSTPTARDLQTAATLALAGRIGLRAAALLIVAETTGSARLPETELEKHFLELGPAVLSVLEAAES